MTRASPTTLPVSPLDHCMLLVLAPTESTAQRIESYLHTAGHACRCVWLSELALLQEHLQQGASDGDTVLFCAAAMARAPLEEVMAARARLAPQISVIACTRRHSPEEAIAALVAGAADYVSVEDQRHLRRLELVTLRELEAGRMRRQLAQLQARVAAYDAHYRALQTRTRDAVAHTQDGILVDLNPAFAERLGYADESGLTGTPVMDLVCPDQHANLRQTLRRLMRADTPADATFDGCLLHADGSRVEVAIQLQRMEVDGETRIRLLIPAQSAVTDERDPAPALAEPVEPLVTLRHAWQRLLAGQIAGLEATHTLDAPDPAAVADVALLCVVDDFAALEERIGHADAEQAVSELERWLGEWCLAETGQTQEHGLAEAGRVLRFSTQEVGILLRQTRLEALHPAVDRLIADCTSQVFHTLEHETQLSISVGLHPLLPTDRAATVTSTLVAGTRRLSTEGGRRSALLGASARTTRRTHTLLEQADRLRAALEGPALHLEFQPIASLEGDPHRLYDVSARLRDDQGQWLPEQAFREAVNRFELQAILDRALIAGVRRAQRKPGGEIAGACVLVPVSPASLVDAAGLMAWLDAGKLVGTLTEPGTLALELDIDVALGQLRRTQEFARQLAQRGCLLAFGGLRSPAAAEPLLAQTDARYLKLGLALSRNLDSPATLEQYSPLLSLARQRGVKTIADPRGGEGGGANTMARLWQLGINFVRGYRLESPTTSAVAGD